jgi:hypothetical protein
VGTAEVVNGGLPKAALIQYARDNTPLLYLDAGGVLVSVDTRKLTRLDAFEILFPIAGVGLGVLLINMRNVVTVKWPWALR